MEAPPDTAKMVNRRRDVPERMFLAGDVPSK